LVTSGASALRKTLAAVNLLPVLSYRYETRREAPLAILRCLFTEIPIQRFRAADKLRSVVFPW